MFLPVSLRIYNFCLIKKATVNFMGAGMNYVVGEFQNEVGEIVSNGAGKSTFLNALWFAISGGLIAKTDAKSCIGRFDDKCSTSVVLKGEGNTISIKRQRNSSGASVLLSINGTPQLTGLPSREINAHISKLLMVDWNIFRLTNYIAQEDSKTGIVYAKDATRKDIVVQLYGLDRLNVILKKSRTMLTKETRSLQALKLQESHLKGKVASANEAVEELRGKGEKSIGNKEVITKRLKKNKARTKKHTKLKQVRKDRRNQRKALLVTLTNELDALNVKYSQLSTETSILQKRYDKMVKADKTKKRCPVCGSWFSTTAKRAYRVSMAKVKDELVALKTGKLATTKKRLAETAANKVRCEKGIAKAHAAYEVSRVELYNLGKRNVELIAELQLATRAEAWQAKVDNLAKKARKLKRELNAIRKDIKAMEVVVGDLQFWTDAYAKEIKALVFQSIVDELTMAVNGYLSYLAGSQFTVKISTEAKGNKELVSLAMTEHDGAGWRPIELASGGQKKLISLAFALAMQSVKPSMLGIMLLDEATENLDNRASTLAIDAIKRASTDKLVLYVTHDRSTVPSGALTIKAIRANGEVDLV